MKDLDGQASMKAIIQGSLEHLEEQIRADPMKAIVSGISFGAGLTALNSRSLREGAILFAKLVTAHILNDIQLPSLTNANPN